MIRRARNHARHRRGNRIPCGCRKDAEGNIIPQEGCEIHWNQVVNGGSLEQKVFP